MEINSLMSFKLTDNSNIVIYRLLVYAYPFRKLKQFLSMLAQSNGEKMSRLPAST